MHVSGVSERKMKNERIPVMHTINNTPPLTQGVAAGTLSAAQRLLSRLPVMPRDIQVQGSSQGTRQGKVQAKGYKGREWEWGKGRITTTPLGCQGHVVH